MESTIPDLSPTQPPVPPKKLMTVEERAEGTVGWHVYQTYIKAANNPWLILATLGSFMIANFAQIGQLYVVSAWTSDIGYKKRLVSFQLLVSCDALELLTVCRPLGVYLGGVTFMASAVAVFTWLRTYISYILGAQASKSLHYDLAKRVVRAPLSYFGNSRVLVL